MSTQLTRGAIRAIHSNSHGGTARLQVLRLKPGDRHRMVLSDGDNYQPAILTRQLNEVVDSGRLAENSIIELADHLVNEIKSKKVIIVIKINNIFPAPASGMIGQPTEIDSGAPIRAGAAPAKADAPRSYGAAGGGGGGYGGGNAYGGGRPSGYGNQGAVARPTNMSNVLPIMALNPYVNRFTIKARVTHKGDVRSWNNQRGSGRLFSADLIDENGTEIRGTFFNDDVDKFYDMLQNDKVYLFSNGRVKIANKRFSNLDNDHEITFGRDTVIQMVAEDNRICRTQYKFIKISDVEKLDKGATCDVLGYISTVRDVVEFTTRAGKQSCKRDIELVDSSGTKVRMTLWGKDATNLTADVLTNSLIAIKGASVGEYNGKNLMASFSSRLDVNPEIPEARELRAWLEANPDAIASAASLSKAGGNSSSVSARKTLAAIVDENLGHGEKPDYVSVKCSVSFVRSGNKNWYPACQNDKGEGRKCNKRITETGSGWHCDSCNHDTDNPTYRYIMSVNISDHTGSQWVTMFDEAATQLVGKSATALDAMYKRDSAAPDDGNPSEVDAIIKEALYKTFVMRIRVHMDTYNDAQRLKFNVQALHPFKYAAESRNLLTAIEAFDAL